MNFKQLKKLAMVIALVLVMIGAAGFGWAEDVSFNYSVQLKWKDYAKTTENYSAYGWADAPPCVCTPWSSCGRNEPETKTYTQAIPFKQEVQIDRS